MSSYCLYGINLYSQALESINSFIKKYPADKNIIYAHYLETLIYFEQIEDDQKKIWNRYLKQKIKLIFF